MGTIAESWEQAQELYDRGYQFIVLIADGVSLGKLAAGTVARFREVYPDRKTDYPTAQSSDCLEAVLDKFL